MALLTCGDFIEFADASVDPGSERLGRHATAYGGTDLTEFYVICD
jgi:hypothetical protein